MNHIGPVCEQPPQHTHGQTQGQQQRGGAVEWQPEAQHIHHLRCNAASESDSPLRNGSGADTNHTWLQPGLHQTMPSKKGRILLLPFQMAMPSWKCHLCSALLHAHLCAAVGPRGVDARSDNSNIVAYVPEALDEVGEANLHPRDMAEGAGLHKDGNLACLCAALNIWDMVRLRTRLQQEIGHLLHTCLFAPLPKIRCGTLV